MKEKNPNGFINFCSQEYYTHVKVFDLYFVLLGVSVAISTNFTSKWRTH